MDKQQVVKVEQPSYRPGMLFRAALFCNDKWWEMSKGAKGFTGDWDDEAQAYFDAFDTLATFGRQLTEYDSQLLSIVEEVKEVK